MGLSWACDEGFVNTSGFGIFKPRGPRQTDEADYNDRMNEPRPSLPPPNLVEAAAALESVPGNPEGALTESGVPVSREEQLARFEDALKEEDWGHQPC